MISVVIPILDEARTVASVVEFALASPGVAEVIVLDDGSVDDGAEPVVLVYQAYRRP